MSSELIPISPSAVDVAYGTSSDKIQPLDPEEVKSILGDEIYSASGMLGSQIAEERRLSLDYYLGRGFGNEIKGRSAVVLTDIADTIEWILPSLMRMFLGSDITTRYTERDPQDAEFARQATEFVNQDFRDEQDGFLLFYNWFKDALIEKNGLAKITVEERRDRQHKRYEMLTEGGLVLLLMDPDLTPTAFSEREDGTYDVDVVCNYKEAYVCAEGVPPEEFLIARRAVKLNDRTPFVAHRRRVTLSDLIALGYDRDVVMGLPLDNSIELTTERNARQNDQDDRVLGSVTRRDAVSNEVWLNDCWIRIDEDGDGFAELRHILCVGDAAITILEDEEVNHQPFCSLTPVPMPHRFFGISIADQLRDLQLIRSTLLRQMLDNLYLTNSPQLAVVEGQVELDDLLTQRPGNIVRVLAPGMVEPIVMQPLSPQAFNMMEWLEGVKEARVGAGRFTQGVDATALKSTATGIASLMAAAQARVELIGRIFAETGVRDFFKKYLQICVSSGVKKRLTKMGGDWVEINPYLWDKNYKVNVEVGLGTGQAAERIAFLGQVLEIQATMAQHGLTQIVSPQNVYNTASRLTEAMGFRQRDVFFSNPEGQPPPPQQPEPKIYESDRRAKDNAADREVEIDKLKAELMKAGSEQEWRRYELTERMKVEREKIASEERIAMRKAELDAEIARRQATAKKKEQKNADAT